MTIIVHVGVGQEDKERERAFLRFLCRHTARDIEHALFLLLAADVDTVLCFAARPNGVLAILGADLLRDSFAIVGAVDVHLAAAIGAIHESGQ